MTPNTNDNLVHGNRGGGAGTGSGWNRWMKHLSSIATRCSNGIGFYPVSADGLIKA